MAFRAYLDAIILGIVQGITEFLPISSDGHLVIAEHLLKRSSEGQPLEGSLQTIVALHVGTLMAILVVYRRDLLELLRKPKACLAVIAATIPTALIGLALKDWIETETQTPLFAGIGLLVTAAFLTAATFLERQDRATADVSLPVAFVIGVFQAVAILPGVSRSGTTISVGLISGLRRETATTFSFLIAVPAIGGAIVLMAKEWVEKPAPVESYGALAVGIAVSFLVGCLALRWLLRLISRNKLHWFAWYCGIVGTITIAWQLLAA